MSHLAGLIRPLSQHACMLVVLFMDAVRFLRLCLRPSAPLAAENLFLHKQLALYQARQVNPRRTTAATRFALVWLAQWCDWHPALTVVHPETFQRWRRQRFRQCWRWPSKRGRPPIPMELQARIRQMAHDNCPWGQRRIANELRLKFGLQVSPRPVRTSMSTRRDWTPGCRVPSQHWRTCMRTHARALIVSGMAADVCTQGVQAVSARIPRFLPGWWGQSVASGWPGSTPRATLPSVLRSETRVVPAAWALGTVEAISEDDRSPPGMRPFRHHAPCTAPRTPSVDTLGLCPTVGVSGEWNRPLAISWSTELLSMREPQAPP